jgi:hypothetical protein
MGINNLGGVTITASSGHSLQLGSNATAGQAQLNSSGLAVAVPTTISSTLGVTGDVTANGALVTRTNLVVGPQFVGFTGINTLEGAWGLTGTYVQNVITNGSTGAVASADYVVNNALSTDTTVYGDFGINSPTFGGTGSLNLPNATYLYSAGGPLVLGTSTPGSTIRMVVESGATDAIAVGAASVTVNLPLGCTVANGANATALGMALGTQAFLYNTTQLTGAFTLTLSGTPVVGSENIFFFQQGAVAQTVTLSLAGVTFYLNGTTTTGSGSLVIPTASIATPSARYGVTMLRDYPPLGHHTMPISKQDYITAAGPQAAALVASITPLLDAAVAQLQTKDVPLDVPLTEDVVPAVSALLNEAYTAAGWAGVSIGITAHRDDQGAQLPNTMTVSVW